MAAEVVLFENIPLSGADTGEQAILIGEPSVANNGREIFMTGNVYATKSLDAGNTWDFVSPSNTLPRVSGGFCCDQTVLYDPSRDITVWILQYFQANNTNTLRVAVKRGDSLGNNVWRWWDYQPSMFNSAEPEWFDYNHASLSNNYLYVGTNVFTPADNFTRCVILRISLDELEAGGDLSASYFQRPDNALRESFSMRCVQGARDTMYFACHDGSGNNRLRLFSWPEVGGVSSETISVTPFNAGVYQKPWLDRCDPRITGAWVGNGIIGFMWTANKRDSAGKPNPHVRVVRIDERTKAVIDEPAIWSSDTAFAYPDACPNDRGDVGITLFQGNDKPEHVVGIWDDMSNNAWDLRVTEQSTHSPHINRWGDYLTCRRHSPDGLTWIAVGYTLQGGGTRANIEPRLVQFGRERDARAVARWRNA